MELRSCNHLHFIQAIKGSFVTKILNVTRGRPSLTFKKLEDIYEVLDAKNHDLLPMLQPKDKSESLLCDSDTTEVKSPRLHTVERRTVKREPETYDLYCHGGDNGINNDLADLEFSDMTLKQIKDRCKTKKRKRSKCVKLSIETAETSSCPRQEFSDLETDEEDLDLQEPLSCWKSKLSKKMKAKKKHMRNHASASSQSSMSIAISEQVPTDTVLPQSSGDLWSVINIKVEDPESDHSDCQNVMCVGDDYSLPCREPKGSCGMVNNEVCGRANECVTETQVSISSVEEPQYCVTNELCYEYMESADPNFLQMLRASGGNSMEVESLPCHETEGGCGMTTSELCERADAGVLEVSISNEFVTETQVSNSSMEEPQYCVTNELCYEYMESADPNFLQIVRVSGGNSMQVESLPCHEPEGGCGMTTSDLCEIADAGPKSIQIVRTSDGDSVEEDNTETTSHECSGFPVADSEKKEYSHSVLHDISPGTISSSINHSSYISDLSQSSSPMDENNDINVQAPHMSICKSTQFIELGYGGDACVFEDDIVADLPSNPKVTVISSPSGDSNLSPDSCLDSVEDNSPTSEEKQPQKSACANAEINISAGIHPCDATDELMMPVDFEYCHHSKPQHPPERLLATRKVISPTSQERLRKAMDSLELQDNEYHNCRGKLDFEKNKIGRVEGPDLIRGAELGINPQQITRKRKNDKRGTPPKIVHKVPNLSGAVPRFSTGCTSIQSCSQSAIEFSQQQMNDFECLAVKLTKELKSMKEILEERLLPEACPASSFKYNVDRARMAIKNATRMEESTKKWLSMMARDCNRFCKIMRMTEKGSGFSGNVAQKERKESTSAYEAVGILVNQVQRLTETGSSSSGNVVHKEKKKITFADEVGGELCHVKFFEDDMVSLSESITDTQELPVN
ncbi:uncharacterized protein LOC115974306 isoform X2 [Quercus lobata]|uniref:uncharacterized protein LOC115974306 isoform X2 n=1 Tax=Quercus lobata TaxID=97700 RepID=UPI001245C98E|nr:uncharacterized protein LOC115974306 isoform X2 [Quercus lobata]